MGPKHGSTPKPQKPAGDAANSQPLPPPDQPASETDGVIHDISDVANEIQEVVNIANDIIGLGGA